MHNSILEKLNNQKKRRTKAEMELERSRLRQEKEVKEQKKNASLARVAQLEDQMAVDDANAGSAHPRNNNGDVTSCTSLCRTNDPE